MAAPEIQSPIDEREFVLAPENEADQKLAPPLGSKVMLPGHSAPSGIASEPPPPAPLNTGYRSTATTPAQANVPDASIAISLNNSLPKLDSAGPSHADSGNVRTTQPDAPVSQPQPAITPSKDPEPPVQQIPVISQPPAPSAILEDDKSPSPRRTPFIHPLPESKAAQPKALTADQQSKYDGLLKTASSWQMIGKTKSPITDSERMWLTRECLLRYLRATKWNEPEAAKRLLGTLVWRREYGVVDFTPDYISPENETGKQVILGFDNAARPCLYLNPGRQNTEHSPRQIQHLVYMLERTIDIMPAGQESLTLLIDFNATKSKTTPSVGQGRQTMSILQNQYPERLGRSVVINIPWFVNTFLKIIGPFIDPVTREKLRFNEPMKNHVPSGQLLREMGGELDFEYVHELYWPAMNELAAQRRALMKERWEAGGKRIGESEYYLRGGAENAVSQADPTVGQGPVAPAV